ncbi:MAG: TrkH family potassium uptake protein [Gammaproteobacteria bacterium]|nr:TrkH family potassium uptake protein [Gammaproteobacteria bacterium]
MHPNAIQRIFGLLLATFSSAMLPPLAVSLISGDGAHRAFAYAFALLLVAGLACWFPVRRKRSELRLRDGFIIVALFWVVLGSSGAVPLVLAEEPSMSVTDALFESISGLTTTGATVLIGIDDLPISILWYRQQLQWLGGMGIIVLAVAILPMLGIGGMQLYRAETPGPMKDSKMTPRITETAKALWYIYLGLTVACAIGYWLAGMSGFDAIAHSFSTVAIGGFSTHDASMGYFDSALIEAVAVVFMFLSGANFALHFLAWRRMSTNPYLGDPEFRAYFTGLAIVAVLTTASLYLTDTFGNFGSALHHGIFQAVSIGTTTGFTTAEYFAWPIFLPVLLLFSSFVGGCAGSTGGGLKVIRFMLLIKQGVREIQRLVHPNAEIPVKVGNKVLPERVIQAVWGFFAVYVASFSVMMLALMATGLGQITAFSAVAACLNNLGPGLGEVGLNYAGINDFAKWVLSLAMLLGRLEIFTLLVLLTPTFWRA